MPAEATPINSCPCCGGTFGPTRRTWIHRCSRCGLLSSTLVPCIPNEKSSTRIDEEARSRGLSAVRRTNNLLILSTLRKLRGSHTGRLLDVGCGQGNFLGDACNAGYDVVGIEPDANVVEYARRVDRAAVLHGPFPSALPPSSTFDVITFNDVLEHLAEPAEMVTKAAEMLSGGGVLVLNCPNRKGVFYRTAVALDTVGWRAPLDRLWQVGLPSPHLWYFTPESLMSLGQHAGLKPLCSIALHTLCRDGLRDRVRYVKGQNVLVAGLTVLSVSAALPILKYLPRDSYAVMLRKD